MLNDSCGPHVPSKICTLLKSLKSVYYFALLFLNQPADLIFWMKMLKLSIGVNVFFSDELVSSVCLGCTHCHEERFFLSNLVFFMKYCSGCVSQG